MDVGSTYRKLKAGEGGECAIKLYDTMSGTYLSKLLCWVSLYSVYTRSLYCVIAANIKLAGVSNGLKVCQRWGGVIVTHLVSEYGYKLMQKRIDITLFSFQYYAAIIFKALIQHTKLYTLRSSICIFFTLQHSGTDCWLNLCTLCK
jgi:hypothetical protein